MLTSTLVTIFTEICELMSCKILIFYDGIAEDLQERKILMMQLKLKITKTTRELMKQLHLKI